MFYVNERTNIYKYQIICFHNFQPFSEFSSRHPQSQQSGPLWFHCHQHQGRLQEEPVEGSPCHWFLQQIDCQFQGLQLCSWYLKIELSFNLKRNVFLGYNNRTIHAILHFILINSLLAVLVSCSLS